MKRAGLVKSFTLILLLLLTGCTTIDSFFEVELLNTSPGVYYDDYSRVWTAAINALDDEGYVIVQMRRSDGYISTDKRERRNERVKLSLRFYNTEDGGILVKINESVELYYGEIDEYGGGWNHTDYSGRIATETLKKRMNEKLPGKFKIKE